LKAGARIRGSNRRDHGQVVGMELESRKGKKLERRLLREGLKAVFGNCKKGKGGKWIG